MNIIGTMYIVDEPHIDVLKQNLLNNPPPKGRIATGTMLCIDMDDGNNLLEVYFPDHTQKASLLLPPPIAMYKEIDGDAEGFIQEYNDYLDNDQSVQEFIASMLLFLHLGGNIIMYSPSYLEDEAIWIQTLIMFFYTRFGITIGGPDTQASYDPRYDSAIADFIYDKGIMDLYDYISSYPSSQPGIFVQNKIINELSKYCSIEDNPLELYSRIKMANMEGIPAKPALMFKK